MCVYCLTYWEPDIAKHHIQTALVGWPWCIHGAILLPISEKMDKTSLDIVSIFFQIFHCAIIETRKATYIVSSHTKSSDYDRLFSLLSTRYHFLPHIPPRYLNTGSNMVTCPCQSVTPSYLLLPLLPILPLLISIKQGARWPLERTE